MALIDDFFKRLSKIFETAIKFIHSMGGYIPSMLTSPEISPLIHETASSFNKAMAKGISKSVIPDAMRKMLEQNIFIFSGFKTHAELSAVSALLMDRGQIKPFDVFSRDVQAINKEYNLNYLRAEYNFAVASSRSAANWLKLSQDEELFYLQYRTAKDDRVREEHVKLDEITLPASNPFWDEYFPPNGWNCRCTVVRVRRGKYKESDSDEAMKAGKNATTKLNKKGQNKDAIFRFNPGKEQKIFPPRHPYMPKGCAKCDKKLAYNPNSPMCQACSAIISLLKK